MEIKMNIDTVAGQGTELKGQFKEAFGDATADPALRQDGVVDQFSGQARQGFGAVRDFVQRQPVVAAVVGALALALLGGLGRRSR